MKHAIEVAIFTIVLGFGFIAFSLIGAIVIKLLIQELLK